MSRMSASKPMSSMRSASSSTSWVIPETSQTASHLPPSHVDDDLDPSRRADDELAPTLQRSDLSVPRCPAVDGDGAIANGPADLDGFGVDLKRQLARGRRDDPDRTPGLCGPFLLRHYALGDQGQ